MTESNISTEGQQFDAAADFCRDGLGVNAFPSESRGKRALVSWSPFENKPLPRELHEEWKRQGLFSRGIMIMPGRAWHKEGTTPLWLVSLDFDKIEPLEDFVRECGYSSIAELGKHTLVVQHDDDKNRAHVHFYTPIPIPKLGAHHAKGIEVKSDGTGLLLFPPSIHKNNCPYRAIGTENPAVMEGLAEKIDAVCKKHSVEYLNDQDRLAQVVLPKYANGTRDELIFAISGLLRKLGWSQRETDAFVTKMCKISSDEEEALRHAVVAGTYSKPLDEIAGASLLSRDLVESIMRVASSRSKQAWSTPAMSSAYSQKLERLVPEPARTQLKQYIGEIVSENGPRFVVADEDDMQIKEVAVVVKEVKAKTGGATSETRVSFGDIVLDAVPKEIMQVHDPLENSVKYTIEFARRVQDAFTIGPLTLPEIVDKLNDTSVVYKPRVLHERLAAILNAYAAVGAVETKIEIDREGFFWIKDRLVASKIVVNKPSAAEARMATEFIATLQSQYYSSPEDIKRLAHCLKLAVQAPFDFARRQNGAAAKYGFIPRLDLAGRSNTGKTQGYGRLFLGMYGLALDNPAYVIGAGSVRTAPRFIDQTSKTTLPVIMDETDFLHRWREKGEIEDYLSVLKNQTVLTHPRNFLTKESKSVKRPSCAYPIITHNSGPIEEDGFSKRYTPIVFTDRDKKAELEQKKFTDFFDKNAEIYTYLGHFSMDYVMQDPSVLNGDWRVIGKKILEEFYRYAGVEFPSWLDGTVENTSIEDMSEQRRAKIAAFLLTYINRAWAQNRVELHKDDVEGAIMRYDLPTKIVLLTQHDMLPGVRHHPDRGICILSPLTAEMEKQGVERVSHIQLAPLCGFEYQNLRFAGEQTKVVCAPLDKFVQFISPKADNVQTTLRSGETQKAETA